MQQTHRNNSLTDEEAGTIAIAALQHLAGDIELLGRFLALSGLEPQDLRSQATDPAFQSGLLQFFLSHEPNLLSFCENRGIAAEDVSAAQSKLAGPDTYIPST